MSERVLIFDTTLRDGEQSAGVCFSARDKLEIAARLASLGVDVVEAGFPGASRAELEQIRLQAKIESDSLRQMAWRLDQRILDLQAELRRSREDLAAWEELVSDSF